MESLPIAALLPEIARHAEVTIFDGTGVGLQDLAVAQAVVELAKHKGVAQEVEI